MNASNFVITLWECAPATEKLETIGLQPKEIQEFRNAHKATKRNNCDLDTHPDPLMVLVNSYDLSSVRIGMVTFIPEAKKTQNGWRVGRVEDDLLIIDQKGEVEVEESDTNGHLLWKCAINGSAFLDALVIAAGFLSDFDRDEEDQSLAIKCAKQCAEAAGGKSYLDFYLMLLAGNNNLQ